MSLEMMHSTNNGNGTDRETLYMLGGVALVVFGAGLILSNPNIRKPLGQAGLGNIASAAVGLWHKTRLRRRRRAAFEGRTQIQIRDCGETRGVARTEINSRPRDPRCKVIQAG